MKKLFFILFLAMIITVSGCGTKTNVSTNTETVIPAGKFYFHSKSCAHCAKVDEYIAQEKVRENIYFISREIDVDAGAVDLLKAVGKKCAIPNNELGVPLFWDGASCYTGDIDVINYFKSLAK